MLWENPFKELTKKEWALWAISLTIVVGANIIAGNTELLQLISPAIGITAVIFVAIGNVWGQILTVVFAILYAIISFQFHYYGEMITYMGMTAPIAFISIITWLKHPYKDENVVEINKLSKKQTIIMWLLAAVVTAALGILLAVLNTPNLLFSTISITTSFLASYLMMMRNTYYGVAYAANDLVLIILWILAAMEDIKYLPMIFCFATFFFNDMYGFISWKMREKVQEA